MLGFKSLFQREVRSIEPQFLTPTGRHYIIQIWLGTAEKVWTGRDVIQLRQEKQRG